MTTTLERIAEKAPDATAPTVTKDQMDLITRTVAKDATPDELKLYLFDCARQGVHPLDKLIHFTVRKERDGGRKYTPVTSIDFMRIRAAESGEYAGSDDAEFLQLNDSVPPSWARVTVYRLVQGQKCSFTATARWAEYKPEANDFMWRKMPHTMLAKCAEALALRKGFPRQLAGLYASEEMDQAQAPAPSVGSGRAERETVVGRGGETNGRSSQAAADSARSLSATDSRIPSVPNGAGSGASLDTDTGQEIPPGYHLIAAYEYKAPWHELVVKGLDAQGGSVKLSTKLDAGFAAEQAFMGRRPVRLDWKPKGPKNPGEGYLNRVYPLPDALPDIQIHEQPVDDADCPF